MYAIPRPYAGEVKRLVGCSMRDSAQPYLFSATCPAGLSYFHPTTVCWRSISYQVQIICLQPNTKIDKTPA